MSFTLRLNDTRTGAKRRPIRRKSEDRGKKVAGEIAEEEARHQLSLKYVEDKKKFLEKEKEKAEIKKQEKWKRYSHVDYGNKLKSNNDEAHPDVRMARDIQQYLYDTHLESGLKREREEEAAKKKRKERKRKEKLAKYAHISTGEVLTNHQQSFSNSECALDLNSGIEQKMKDINLNANHNENLEKKTKRYQEKKLFSETSDLNLPGPSTTEFDEGENHDIPLIEGVTNRDDPNASMLSQIEKEKMYREQMKLARERMQRQYDEEKNSTKISQ